MDECILLAIKMLGCGVRVFGGSTGLRTRCGDRVWVPQDG